MRCRLALRGEPPFVVSPDPNTRKEVPRVPYSASPRKPDRTAGAANRTDNTAPVHISSLTVDERRLVMALITMRDEKDARLAMEEPVAA